MSLPALGLSPNDWALAYRRDDGEQQPISPVEREFGAESLGKRQGLEVMNGLMEGWGHPERAFPSIHVAGSKGKGSTVAMLSAILRAAGYRVGSYTSPSLTHFGERIQVNGRTIQDAEAEGYIEELRPLLRGLPDQPRFFEVATAIAFQHFARQQVDVAVVEVGLGGRLDATNVLLPELSLITSIELEHTQILGDTLEAIALEKAGIIKPGVPAVTAVTQPGPAGTIERLSRDRGSLLLSFQRDFDVTVVQDSINQQCIDLRLGPLLGDRFWRDVVVGLPGEAQSTNAALAAVAAWWIRDRFNRINESVVREGLADARWPGRLELVSTEPPVLLDVAHTPASAHQLRRHLDRFFADRPKTLVIGMLRDKRYEQVATELAAPFGHVLVAPVKWFRSMDPNVLMASFLGHSDSVESAPSICAAIERARQITPAHGLIVVAGSLFAVGEAKRRFGWV